MIIEGAMITVEVIHSRLDTDPITILADKTEIRLPRNAAKKLAETLNKAVAIVDRYIPSEMPPGM